MARGKYCCVFIDFFFFFSRGKSNLHNAAAAPFERPQETGSRITFRSRRILRALQSRDTIRAVTHCAADCRITLHLTLQQHGLQGFFSLPNDSSQSNNEDKKMRISASICTVFLQTKTNSNLFPPHSSFTPFCNH